MTPFVRFKSKTTRHLAKHSSETRTLPWCRRLDRTSGLGMPSRTLTQVTGRGRQAPMPVPAPHSALQALGAAPRLADSERRSSFAKPPGATTEPRATHAALRASCEAGMTAITFTIRQGTISEAGAVRGSARAYQAPGRRPAPHAASA